MALPLVFSAPPARPAPLSSRSDLDEHRLRALGRRWAWAVGRGRPDEIAALLGDRPVFVPPDGGRIRGHAAVVKAWRRIFAQPDLRIDLEPDRFRLYPAGDLAHEVCRYRIARGSLRAPVDFGNQVVEWERVGAAWWRVRSNLFYSLSPHPARLLPGQPISDDGNQRYSIR